MEPSCLELKDVMTVDWDTTKKPRAKWDGGKYITLRNFQAKRM